MRKLLCILWTMSGAILMASCDKQNAWLDVKSNKSDVILSTAKDYQAVLDGLTTFNLNQPNFAIVCTDNITADLSLWEQSQPDVRNAYIFAQRVFDDPTSPPLTWTRPYRNIAHCNIIIEGVQEIKNNTPVLEYNNIRGSALFFRASNYFDLTQDFTVPYNTDIANTALGVPIRQSSDVNEKSFRPSLQANYDYIIDDLKNAEKLLPDLPTHQTRPSKCSARAMLARVYLTVGDYKAALDYANEALSIYNTLIDLNDLSTTAQFSFPTYPNNTEVVFYSTCLALFPLATHTYYARIEPSLYAMYEDDDLRKSLFYFPGTGGVIHFKGQYTGGTAAFRGVATNELFLIKAEALARLGNANTALAMEALNSLLIKRWKQGTFVPFSAGNADAALQLILTERRKELPFLSDMRWQDLRRLNQEPRFATRVVHTLDGVDHILEPNSSRYVFDIPAYEIKLSGIEQNQR